MPIPNMDEFEKLLDDLKIKNENLRNILVCIHEAARIHARNIYERMIGDEMLYPMSDRCRKLYIVGAPLSMLGLCKDGRMPMEFCNAAYMCVATATQRMSSFKKMKLQMSLAKLVNQVTKCVSEAEKKRSVA